MRRVVLLLVAWLAVSPVAGAGGLRAARVTRVIDGDTADAVWGGRERRVRFIGIDTPEWYECYGGRASRFTERRLEGEWVRLEFDRERLDPYGRTLAYVWQDGRLFNRVLVARGYARVTIYPPNDRYEDRLRRAQRLARSEDRGLWGAC